MADESQVTPTSGGDDDERPTIRFARELGLTHTEFHRSLPPAIAHRPFRLEEGKVIVEDGVRTVTISLGPQQERRIASLRLPFVVVDFEFRSYTVSEFEDFMQRFERYFQRGGG